MLKYMRIAVTALCLTACAMIVALWVRSYFIVDACRFTPITSTYHIQSVRGQILIFRFRSTPRGWKVGSFRVGHIRPIDLNTPVVGESGTVRYYVGANKSVVVPCFAILMFLIALGVIPWRIQWSTRFSLRTLLIATALVAVALSVIVLPS
jgi:hypothetical protein